MSNDIEEIVQRSFIYCISMSRTPFWWMKARNTLDHFQGQIERPQGKVSTGWPRSPIIYCGPKGTSKDGIDPEGDYEG